MTAARMMSANSDAAPTTIGSAWRVLAVLCAAQLVVVLNFQIVAIALPRIGTDLAVPPVDLQWVMTVNALTFGGVLLLGGRAADLFGHRRLFMAGLGVYALASAACGLAPTAMSLIAARAVQGLGAALFVPATLALIADAFPAGPLRDRALGAWAAAGPVGGILSVAIGGAVADAFGWRAVFLISLPLAAMPLVLAPLLLSTDRDQSPRGLDLAGTITGTGGIVAVVYAFDQAARHGLASPPALTALVIGIALLATFVVVERRVDSPLVPTAVLRSGSVLGGSMVAFLHGAATNTPIVFFAIYMQQVRGASLLVTGLAFLPANLALIVAAAVGARVAARAGFGITMIAGMAAIGVGLLLQATIAVDSSYVMTLLPGLVIQGFGVGLALIGIVGAVTAGAAPADRGIAAGLMNTSAQIGTAIGLALLVAVAATRAPAGTEAGPALVSSVQWAFGAAALLAAIGAVVAILVTRCMASAPAAAGGDRPAGR